MMHCALINPQTGVVENVIVADPAVDPAPEGFLMVAADDAVAIGWTYNSADGTFTAPPEPPEEASPVPESVTPRQVRLLLLQQGLLQQVEDMIAASDQATKITWEFATVFLRNDPLLNQLAASLTPPLTPEQIDQFFIAAAAL